jgi:spore coat protein U-like protein
MTGKHWMVVAAGTLAIARRRCQAAVSGQINARLILIAGCEVTNTSTPASPVSDLGTLDFGLQGPTWNAPIKASLDGDSSGKLNVACNPFGHRFHRHHRWRHPR